MHASFPLTNVLWQGFNRPRVLESQTLLPKALASENSSMLGTPMLGQHLVASIASQAWKGFCMHIVGPLCRVRVLGSGGEQDKGELYWEEALPKCECGL